MIYCHCCIKYISIVEIVRWKVKHCIYYNISVVKNSVKKFCKLHTTQYTNLLQLYNSYVTCNNMNDKRKVGWFFTDFFVTNSVRHIHACIYKCKVNVTQFLLRQKNPSRNTLIEKYTQLWWLTLKFRRKLSVYHQPWWLTFKFGCRLSVCHQSWWLTFKFGRRLSVCLQSWVLTLKFGC